MPSRITDLTPLTGAGTASGDLLVIVDVSDASMAATGTDKNISIAELLIGLAALPLAGGTLTGSLIVDSFDIKAINGADYVQVGVASGLPFVKWFNSGVVSAVLQASSSGAALDLNVGLNVAGALSTTAAFAAVGLASIGSGVSSSPAGGSLVLRASGVPLFVNFTNNTGGFWGNLGTESTGDLIYETSPSGEAAFGTGTEVFRIKKTGGAVCIGSSGDTAFSRNASGVMEINNSSAGTFRDLKLRDLYSTGTGFMHRIAATITSGAGASTGTLTNAPSAGNPTKWMPIDDNGTTRYIPCW